MHELSIATQIVETVLEEAKRHEAMKITEVQLGIGKMTFLGTEQVRFSYKILTENTIMQDSKLVIEEKDGIIECYSCGYKGKIPLKNDITYHIPVPTLQWPKCGKAATIVEGKECTIKSIKIVKKGEET
jgi:hydrogenase nickel incorporation protein HypA/HybF